MCDNAWLPCFGSPPLPSRVSGQDEARQEGRERVSPSAPHLCLCWSWAVGAQHVVALCSSPLWSVLPAGLPKPCGELTWCYTLHLLPEHALVKFSHILSQSVPLKRELMVRFIEACWWGKFLSGDSTNTSVHLKGWWETANKKVSSPYLELTRTFQAVALFLAHSSVFTWRLITHSYVGFPYI